MSELVDPAPGYSRELTKQSDTDRFVPAGIDARTWLGFEERIRQRRFRALLESIEVSIQTCDRAAALAAIQEARQLRPGARELVSASARATALPCDALAAIAPASFWSRISNAVALLMVGVSMLIGLDWLQTSRLPPLPPSAVSVRPLESLNISRPVQKDGPYESIEVAATAGRLNVPAIEVVSTAGQLNIPAIQAASTSRPRPVRPRRAAGPVVSDRPVRSAAAVAEPVAASTASPVGWRKVFKPTKRFLTNTLPRFLGVRVVPASEEQPAEQRSST